MVANIRYKCDKLLPESGIIGAYWKQNKQTNYWQIIGLLPIICSRSVNGGSRYAMYVKIIGFSLLTKLRRAFAGLFQIVLKHP